MFLNEMHWSEHHQAYLDFGFHTEDIRLERPPINSKTHRPGMPKPEKIRVTKTSPKLQYVPQLGYNSEFKFGCTVSFFLFDSSIPLQFGREKHLLSEVTAFSIFK